MTEASAALSGAGFARRIPLTSVQDRTLLLGHANGTAVILVRQGDLVQAVGGRLHALRCAAGRWAAGRRYGALPLAPRLFQLAQWRGPACPGPDPDRLLEGRTARRRRRLHPRQHRARRGRPDASTGRATGRPARDAALEPHSSRRSQRDRGRMACRAGADRPSGRAGVDAAEAANPRAHDIRIRRWPATRCLCPDRCAGRQTRSDPDRERVRVGTRRRGRPATHGEHIATPIVSMPSWDLFDDQPHDFADLGAGQGGYNEDHEFYGCRMPI